MNRIGVLYGMEESFPPALVERINQLVAERDLPDLRAESLKVGAVRMAEASGYRVIIDRISQDVPFYRAFLKNAVLSGCTVLNNPFWWSADDKFFNYALASRLGIATPRTALLPHKDHPPDTTARSMRNLTYPLDWDGLFAYIGFPAFLKPHAGGGWKSVYKVESPEDVFRAYDETGILCMTLQEGIDFQEYYRCYVIGQQKVRLMRYDPLQPHHLRYVEGNPQPNPELAARITADCLTLCQALGYDINTVEFAVKDGVPYAIDFLNPAPDAARESVGEENFAWVVDAVAMLAIDKAMQPVTIPDYRWQRILEG
ncbi:MAG: hypothetical protein MUF01_07560 [Bryobacterales bacterium]|nr:hypothetical protein [Bryobacterales bacterium]